MAPLGTARLSAAAFFGRLCALFGNVVSMKGKPGPGVMDDIDIALPTYAELRGGTLLLIQCFADPRPFVL